MKDQSELLSPDAAPEVQQEAAPVKASRGRPKKADKKTGAERQRDYKAREKAELEKVALKFDNTEEPSKRDILKILNARGISNNHCLEVIYDLGMQATERYAPAGLVGNSFFWQNGLAQTLKSMEADKPLPLDEIPNEFIPGELLNRPTLHALHDLSIAWKEPDLTLETFIQTRLRCKSDAFFLGKEVLHKDFAQVHQNWTNFLPRFNPLTLPAEYTQNQAIKWLASQAETRDYILLSSRGAFKSSFSHLWALTLILCLPDARILLVSENKGLALDFVGAIKNYFLSVPGQDSRFLDLFPEYALQQGHEGSVLVLDCPMQRLHLPQSIEATSISSAVAGRRFDALIGDDILSNNNSGDEEQRQSVKNKYSMLLKLRESGAGLVLLLGTPYHPDDLYAQILSQAEESRKEGDNAIACRLDPAWTLKEGVDPKTPLKDLREDQVNLLFPERLSFAVLKRELRRGEREFLSQNLIVFPKEIDADEKFTFDLEVLRNHVRPASFFLDARTLKTCLIVDPALVANSGISDFTALCAIRIMQRGTDREFAVVFDLDMARMRQSDIPTRILAMHARHHFSHILIERTGAYENLQTGLARQAYLRGVYLPEIYWRPTVAAGISPISKVRRIKNLSIPLADDILWFQAGEYFAAIEEQASRFNGRKSSGTKHDDALDAISLGMIYLPNHLGDLTSPKSVEQEDAEKTANDIARMKAWAQHIHGTSYSAPLPRQEESEPESSIFRGLGQHLRRKN